ncbi:MAG: dicarboxylate/amino acid:cation symporter, partial [Bacillota bacterium]|nr:dicarboxylate/amino acid:cation symporter [Bacillota bacterium]
MRLTTKIFIGLILGLFTGILLNTVVPHLATSANTFVLKPLGTLFMSLIKMMVVPLVLFSIISGAASIGDPKKLGRLGGKTVAFYLFTTSIAITIGLLLANIFKPGDGIIIPADLSDFSPAGSAPPIMDTFLNIVPTNPIAAMANGEMLQVIVFALFIGVAIGFLGEKAKSVLNIVNELNLIMIEIVHLIMKLAPYGVFALIATAVAGQGTDVLLPMAKYMLVLISGLLLHAFVTYGVLVKALAKMNPVHFFKGVSPAAAVAFSTSSSAATLPVTMESVEENLGVKREISSFVLPLG